MAKLPTEQDIGDLPDHLPRRMGVGGWQPGDLERGAQQLARGGEQFGMDIGMLAGQQAQQENEAQLAAAQSQVAVAHIQTAQAVTASTDPSQVGMLRENYGQNVDDAAQLIKNPDVQAKFRMMEAPKVAQYQVGADERATGLVKNQAVADFGTNSTNLINAAVNTDDPGQRASALGAIKAQGISLVNRGLLTPEEWQAKARETQHDYATARIESEIARAKATGDTSRLQDLAKEFSFNPGEWGTTTPGAAPASPGNLDWSADSGNAQNPGPQLADKSRYLMNVAVNNLGATPAAAAAMVGHAIAESSLRTNVANEQGESSHGMFQLNQDAGRWQPYLDWAKANGKDVNDPASQMQYAKVEAQSIPMKDGSGRSVWDAVNQAKTSSDANQIWLTNFEKPRDQSQSVHDWRQKNVDLATASYAGGAPGGAPGGAVPAVAPRAVGDSIARGVGGVTGSMNAATGANPQQVLSMLRGQDVTTTHRDATGATVSETAPGLKDSDLKGPIVLSTGASNDPNSASLVKAQLAVLKGRGVDLSNVTVLGVGNRADFQKVGVNATLQKAAQDAGAKFQPLDAGMIGPDGVHPIPQGYKAIAGQIGGASSGSAPPPGPAPFLGVTPPGATGANPHLTPPTSQWPPGASGVEHNDDGSLSYVMDDGRRLAVPGSRASGAPGAPSPSGTGTLLDALKPQDRAELGLKLQNEIDAIDRGREAQNNQYTKAAVGDLKARVESMTSGYPIGPNEAPSMAPYANSPIPEVRKAYAETMAIRDNLSAYRGMSPAKVQSDVQQKEAYYNWLRETHPNDPSIERVGLILNAAQKYAKTFETEGVKQPLEWATKTGLLPQGTAPIDPNDPNVESALQRRVADAHTAAEAVGVPIRYLQQSERPMMKEIARNGGQPMVDMAMHIVKAAGADAPQIFKEIGVDAPMFQKIGEMAASGGDPEAVKDIASVINARSDKSARSDLPTFNDKMLKSVGDPLGGTMSRFGPDFEGRTRAAANMLMTAAAQRDGWDPKIDTSNYNNTFVNKAYDLAVGATFAPDGTKYGGIVERNPRSLTSPSTWGAQSNRVIAPNTMKADDFPKVINSITDADLRELPNAPRGPTGIPITAAQIHNSQLESMPDKDGIFRGKYAVMIPGADGKPALARDGAGKPWALDLAQPQLDSALRGRKPNSYQSAAPATAPSAPASPGRYRDTPGTMALTNEAETN